MSDENILLDFQTFITKSALAMEATAPAIQSASQGEASPQIHNPTIISGNNQPRISNTTVTNNTMSPQVSNPSQGSPTGMPEQAKPLTNPLWNKQ